MERFYELEPSERIALTLEAREHGDPLLARWATVQPEFGDRWEERAALAARWLSDAGSVADLGCGAMNLESFLDPAQTYLPVDLAQRDERTLVLDLNHPSDLHRLPSADACALLGVLEYAYAPGELLAAARRAYAQVLVSFNVLHPEQPIDARLENGWVNHFTYDELVAMFGRHGLSVTREHLFPPKRRREYLFDLRRDDV